MEQKKHHYTGLTDEQVLQSRQQFGANILTPPEEQSTWEKIKDCMHFWLLKFYLDFLFGGYYLVISKEKEKSLEEIRQCGRCIIGPVDYRLCGV